MHTTWGVGVEWVRRAHTHALVGPAPQPRTRSLYSRLSSIASSTTLRTRSLVLSSCVTDHLSQSHDLQCSARVGAEAGAGAWVWKS